MQHLWRDLKSSCTPTASIQPDRAWDDLQKRMSYPQILHFCTYNIYLQNSREKYIICKRSYLWAIPFVDTYRCVSRYHIYREVQKLQQHVNICYNHIDKAHGICKENSNCKSRSKNGNNNHSNWIANLSEILFSLSCEFRLELNSHHVFANVVCSTGSLWGAADAHWSS